MASRRGIRTTVKDKAGELALTVVFREMREGDGSYFMAECLELPGCVSQGDTQAEAHANIQDAIQLCLSVVFEDCVKQMMARHEPPDLRGISSQERLTINTTPQLQYA